MAPPGGAHSVRKNAISNKIHSPIKIKFLEREAKQKRDKKAISDGEVQTFVETTNSQVKTMFKMTF